MQYDKITEQIKACEAEYDKKSQEAKKSYDELIEKYFYSMRDKIVEVVKPLTEEEMKEYIRVNLSRHKMPRYIWFMDKFPMTASGKIQKYKMREAAIDALNLHEAAGIETA